MDFQVLGVWWNARRTLILFGSSVCLCPARRRIYSGKKSCVLRSAERFLPWLGWAPFLNGSHSSASPKHLPSLQNAKRLFQRHTWGDTNGSNSSGWMFCPISKRSEEHTSELQSHLNLVCRLLLEKKKN